MYKKGCKTNFEHLLFEVKTEDGFRRHIINRLQAASLDLVTAVN